MRAGRRLPTDGPRAHSGSRVVLLFKFQNEVYKTERLRNYRELYFQKRVNDKRFQPVLAPCLYIVAR